MTLKTRKRIIAAGALVALAAGTGLVRAQGDEGVRLEYRWKPGQVLRYQLTTTGRITTKMEGLPEGVPLAAGGFPMDVTMAMEMHQRVKEVASDGTASITQQLHNLNMTNKVMGQQMVAKFEGGKFSMLVNGQPMAVPPGQGANPGEQMGRVIDMKISRRGQVLGLEGAAREALQRVFQGAQINHAFGAGTMGAGMLVLPEAPVHVGQKWEDSQVLRVPIPTAPGGIGGTPIEVSYRVQNTLSKVEPGAAGAGRLALIATHAEATMPETKLAAPGEANKAADGGLPPGGLAMTIRDFKQTVDGTVRFDPDAGAVQGGDYKVGLAMKMEMPFGPPGAEAGAAAARPMMSMSGDLTMKVVLLPEKGGKATAAPAAR
jgi:hypothetical protein